MRIPIKGKGYCIKVTKELNAFVKESLPNLSNKVFQREYEPIAYILHYLSGFISRSEMVRCLDNWFIEDNLEMTSLMDFVNEHEKEWKDIAKNPEEWFDTYIKVIDPITGGRAIVLPDKNDIVPRNKTDAEILEEKMDQLKHMYGSSQRNVQNPVGPAASSGVFLPSPKPAKYIHKDDDDAEYYAGP